MKGRPHIILRFSKTVAPPGKEPPSLLSPPTSELLSSSNTQNRKDRTTSRRSPLSLENSTENMSRSSTTSSRMKKKKSEKPRSDETNSHTTKAATTVTTPGGSKETVGSERTNSDGGASRQSYSVSPAPTTTSATGKRKRDIPKSIGGGKGDLQPPGTQKRPKRRGKSTPAVNGSSPSSSGETNKDEDKRVLRSQDTKKKSEFEEWFEAPELNYDIQMSIDVKELSNINGSGPRTPTPTDAPPTGPVLRSPLKAPPAKSPEDPEITRIRNLPIQTIDLEEELQKSNSRHTRYTSDPLADEMYIQPHRSAIRGEKRNKNIERDLIHHNATKIEGDLEKLHSPDWIKLIGLSNGLVTRCTKKELEQRKKLVVNHLNQTLEKYKAWCEAEKRKRHRTSKSPKGSQGSQGSQKTDTDDADTASDEEEDDEEASSHDENDDMRSSRRGKKLKPSPRSASASKAKKDPPKAEPEFTSFYDRPSMRQQALSNRRKSSRIQTAFGQPLPTIEEKDFELPEELLASTVAARHARARKRLSR
ncbi:hypothetical protein BDD12DRAFT_907228 [Trichophaea hybrida]|nr:hypothetical protein BDD12DRAFT_907228 [Trichophaea hybrida]